VSTATSCPDRVQAALAAFAAKAVVPLDAELEQAASLTLIDAVAVALGALQHEAAVAARRYGRLYPVTRGATIWGTGEIVAPETATLVNGVPLRGYDFNDLYIGKCGGHPSDILPGLIALAEARSLSGRSLLEAMVVGYEVTVALMDAVNLKLGGWDYPVITAIGATCAACRLLSLSEQQTREALAITVIPHLASLEPESGDLNARGDLTMWKRFNGSDATRQAVYATLLAEVGVEGVVRPFEGRYGLWEKVGATGQEADELIGRLGTLSVGAAQKKITFKRWPVGSRAQSAIQAALSARGQLRDVDAIREVRIHADKQVYEHLVSSRVDAWAPHSRETADHSLPYIVVAALLDGKVNSLSFERTVVTERRRQAFLKERVKAFVAEELSQGAAAGFLCRVEVIEADGRVVVGEAMAPPGHPLQPFTPDDFRAKFCETVVPMYGKARTDQLYQALSYINEAASVGDVVRLMVLPENVRL
jgi:Uncharacterized protein involved in propionate catabolism